MINYGHLEKGTFTVTFGLTYSNYVSIIVEPYYKTKKTDGSAPWYCAGWNRTLTGFQTQTSGAVTDYISVGF